MRLKLKLLISILTATATAVLLTSFIQARILAQYVPERYLTHLNIISWVGSLVLLIVLGVVISVMVHIITETGFVRPIRFMIGWAKRVRLGEEASSFDVKQGAFLRALSKEVSQLGASLSQARASAEEEARLRHVSESVWTPERLKEFVRLKLNNKPLYVVSNREPYEHRRVGQNIECTLPASGLVTAIEPVLKACGGTWIAQGSGDADRESVDEHDRLKVPPDDPQYSLRRVWVNKKENEGYYYGFANEGIWPLCHIAHTRPTFRNQDWKHYQAVNERFAAAVLEEIRDQEDPCVLIQDYHFALLPKMIRDARPDARIALFWHIPWPNPESYGICPWKKEILEGMLSADILGFHTQYHCNNFLESVERFLECRIDYEHFLVNREGMQTWIKPFPISIAFIGSPSDGKTQIVPGFDRESLLRPYGIEADYIAVGVDRIDYTKGILERLQSVEHFLEKNPSYQGRFTFVELGAPSRTMIPQYQDLSDQLNKETERINKRFMKRFPGKDWQPILLLEKHHSREVIASFYRMADICLVTSLHDGMNLVAKEFVNARDDERGVLILSQFTGAAMELKDALIINPYDIAETAQAIHKALEMSSEEQTERMRQMRDVLRDRNIYRWAGDLVNELSQIRHSHESLSAV